MHFLSLRRSERPNALPTAVDRHRGMQDAGGKRRHPARVTARPRRRNRPVPAMPKD